MGAIYHLGAIGTREALDFLVARYSNEVENRGIVFGSIERLAGQLGVAVVETDAGLRVDG
ncbi:MAG: hypothetical protein WDN76_05185 [Alphaproteobacteria bacterium]